MKKYTENQKKKILEKCMTFSDIEMAIDKINSSKGVKINKALYFGDETASSLDKNRLYGEAFMYEEDEMKLIKLKCSELELSGETFREECIQEIKEYYERNHSKISKCRIDGKDCLVYGEIVSDFSSNIEITNTYLVKRMSPEKGCIIYAMMRSTSYGDFGNGAEVKKYNDGTTEFCQKYNYIGSDEESWSTSYTFSPYGKLIKVSSGDYHHGDYDSPSAHLKPNYKEKVKKMKEKIIKENIMQKHGIKR